MEYKKKLIEVALPLPEINDASAYDKMPGIGPHPKGIHHWWARLPLPTARAVLFASIVDDPSSNSEKFPTEEVQNAERERLFDIVRELMHKKLHERPDIYAKAREEMLKHTNGNMPPVLDPFSGGGSIPLEAARLGFETHAADLNPVAVLLNKCNLELVPRWLHHPPVNPKVKDKMFNKDGWSGSQGLAEDVRHYGNLIRERAIAKIGHLYPNVKLPKEYGGHETNVIAWLWARTIKCPNPACGARAPLVRSFWLSRKNPNYVHAKPVLKGKSVIFTIENGGTAEKETTSGKGARCIFCGQTLSKAQVREVAMNFGIVDIPLATVADIGRGRVYLPSDSVWVPEVTKPEAAIIEQNMTDDRRWFSPPLYGWPKFTDIFTPRQLTAMVTLSDLIKDVRIDVIADAIKAGVSNTDADEYATTITTFLALALGRCADFNNSLCRWKPSGQQSMQLFARQAIPMVWDFCEPNILGEKAVCWKTAVNICADAIETISTNRMVAGGANQVDAAGAWNDTRGLLVSTDPPYYDNIGYAALSDFFYVWLRRTIGDLYPDLFVTILVPKASELTAAPERFNGDKVKAKNHFESGFRKAFATLREKIDSRFPLTIYYAFKQGDEQASEEEDDNGDSEGVSNGVDLTTGWETLLDALVGSGFQITATWPVRASQKWRMIAMGTNALASYIVLACRSRHANAPQCSRREFLNDLKRELPAALKHLQQGNIAPVDLAQASIGPGMTIYSRYSNVLEADGSAMPVRTALHIINQELDIYLSQQEGELDRDTRFCIDWFSQYGMNEAAFGEADTLARAKNTSVHGLVEAGVAFSKAGKFRLMKRDEYPEDWDPTTDTRLTVWECTQHLIRVLETEGETKAAELSAKIGGRADDARALAYRLYSICERKGWAQEALSYNSLVIVWPELMKLSRSKPEDTEDVQGTLL